LALTEEVCVPTSTEGVSTSVAVHEEKAMPPAVIAAIAAPMRARREAMPASLFAPIRNTLGIPEFLSLKREL
jgi:hypothetical protein